MYISTLLKSSIKINSRSLFSTALLDDYIELEEKYEAAKISAKKSPVVTKNDEL